MGGGGGVYAGRVTSFWGAGEAEGGGNDRNEMFQAAGMKPMPR